MAVTLEYLEARIATLEAWVQIPVEHIPVITPVTVTTPVIPATPASPVTPKKDE